MAVLASQDWHPPRDLPMDAPSNAINSAAPRQRSSPANDHPTSSSPVGQQPYPYPVQQQQAGWTQGHPQAQPYYPSFYQNHHQPPLNFPLQGHPNQNQMHPQNGYYDPANAQFAQWAYQQMMYNAASAHQMSHVPPPHVPSGGQRMRSGSASTSSDYFVSPGQMGGYSPFPSGTPPAHPAQLPNGYSPQSEHGHQQTQPQFNGAGGPQYNGYHPYRRPNRQGSSHQDSQPAPTGDWRSGPSMGTFQPPYARADAAGSSTSVNSSHSGGSRHRKNSAQGPPSTGAPNNVVKTSSASSMNGRGGTSSPSGSSSTNPQRPHQRTTSSSSAASSATSRPSVASSSAAPVASPSPPVAALRKPSPLSQGNFTAAEKRMSRDDSDLAAMLEPAPGVRSGGLKGRLRRVLSLNAGTALREEDEDDHGKNAARHVPTSAGSRDSQTVAGDDESTSTATVQKKKSRSLFNSRLNRSTDNISLSSTMSSASMVIRKLGNLGKLGRRNSLAGITSLFKDKKNKEAEEEDKKGKKKNGKGAIPEPSVTHATAELEAGEWSHDMTGLSPAARLARQHTLKSNAEAAARAKAEAEAKAAAQKQQNADDPNLPATWEKNTTSRQGDILPGGRGQTRVNEDGSRVLVEDDDTDSDEGHHGGYHHGVDGWEEDDDDWGEAQDEDTTIRQALEGTSMDDDEEMEPWAMNVRRSAERVRRPKKGILKNGTGYQQDSYHQQSPPYRLRANSYDSPAGGVGPELGPLARIPSPDPDHIDGLHRQHPPHSPSSPTTFLPSISFESKGLTLDAAKDTSETGSTMRSPTPERGLFSHPNSSAPALSTMFASNPPMLTHRSATTPAKRLAFASNLSVYDTFPPSVYDRRSEPATWSRLTPALAQRIKEELNSYKMEEMEVHAASRVHTQFFV